jgi:hypothetical protein
LLSEAESAVKEALELVEETKEIAAIVKTLDLMVRMAQYASKGD